MNKVATIAGAVTIIASLTGASANAAPSGDGSDVPVMIHPTAQGNAIVNPVGLQMMPGCIVGIPAPTSPRHDSAYPAARPGPTATMIPITVYVNVPC